MSRQPLKYILLQPRAKLHRLLQSYKGITNNPIIVHPESVKESHTISLLSFDFPVSDDLPNMGKVPLVTMDALDSSSPYEHVSGSPN